MTKLSMSTRRVTFGDVAINSTTVSADPEAEGFDRYIIGKHIPEEGDRIETWGPVGDSDFGPRIRTIFQPGDVICTTRGPKLKVARVDFRGLGAHTNFYLRTADPEVLLPLYLEAVVRSNGFQQHLVNNFRGSVNLFVNWSDAAKYEFALPPLEEQRRIAEVLHGIQSTVVAYQAAYQRAFSTQVRMCMDIGKHAECASEAERSTVESSFVCLDSQRVPLNETQRNANTGDIPYYGATGQVDTVGEYIFDEPLILVAEDGGPFGEFDKKHVAYPIKGKTWVNNHAHVLRPQDDERATWLLMNLIHRDLRAYTSGSTRGKLNKGQLMRVPIWVPDQVVIQSMESTFLTLGSAMNRIEERIHHLHELRTSVMAEVI